MARAQIREAKEPRTWKTTRPAEKSFANGWRLRRISDIPKNRLRRSPKRRRSKTSSIAVDGIRTRNFGGIRTRRLWDGSYLALESSDRRLHVPPRLRDFTVEDDLAKGPSHRLFTKQLRRNDEGAGYASRHFKGMPIGKLVLGFVNDHTGATNVFRDPYYGLRLGPGEVETNFVSLTLEQRQRDCRRSYARSTAAAKTPTHSAWILVESNSSFQIGSIQMPELSLHLACDREPRPAGKLFFARSSGTAQKTLVANVTCPAPGFRDCTSDSSRKCRS